MLTEAAQASPALADKPTRSWHTTGAGRQGCRPGLTDQMCGPGFNQRAPPPPPFSPQGAKKLCPQCNTITAPGDLRRIYL